MSDLFPERLVLAFDVSACFCDTAAVFPESAGHAFCPACLRLGFLTVA